MLRRVLIIAAIAAAGGLFWITETTAPASVHPLVVLVVFGLLYVLVLAVLTFLLFWGTRVFWRFVYRNGPVQRAGLSFRRSYIYASVLAFGPVVLLAMRSVGQQGLGDTLLVVLFEALACFYVWRQT